MAEKDSQRTAAKERSAMLKSIGLLGVITSEILVCTGLGGGLGYLAWARLGLPIWLIAVGGIAGLGLAMFRLYRVTQKDVQDE
jgi:hypothetical protein